MTTTAMRNLIIALLTLIMGNMAAEAQTVQQIRRLYGDAKKAIAENGKNGMAPLDVKMTMNGGTMVTDDEAVNDVSELTFHFNKHRIDSSLDYPDASILYFITENWNSNGHRSYREILFDPNEGYLIFSYMRVETHAGLVIESRYYYGADGRLVDQKHKLGGKETTANAQSWSSADGDKELAGKYLDIFETLMNRKNKPTVKQANGQNMKGNPARMKFIRETYAKAKEKVKKNSQSVLPLDLQIIIRDQSWGPPEVTDLKFYYEEGLNALGANGATPGYHCYFASKHHHCNGMGPESYDEFLFSPQGSGLIFNYCRAVEENQKNEWRYYYDDNGNCIEAKTNADGHDEGADDKQTAKRYQELFDKICDVASH